MYELTIIGAGPAGTSAAVYAARKQIKTLMLTMDFQSQSAVSPKIHNWIGSPEISGADLAKSFRSHVDDYIDKGYLDLKTGAKVTKIEKSKGGFKVMTETGDTYQTKAVLISTGSSRRRLSISGAEKFENKGIVYCATCDGPLFSGQDVVVIGGGNAGFETAAQLTAYTKSVTLLHRGAEYKADKITVEKVLAKENMTGILNAEILEVLGDKFVSGLKYKNVQTGEEKQLDVTGIFVEIGQIPNTNMVADVLELDEYKRITIDPWNQRSSTDGIWAAGDCTNVRYHQNNISAGDAIKALEDIYMWLQHQAD